MRKPLLSIGAVVLTSFASVAASAEPAITFRTNIYENAGEENSFFVRMGASETTTVEIDGGFGRISYEVAPATYDTENQTMITTKVACTVSSEGVVKIYGDPLLIDYLDTEGEYISQADFSQCVNLEILAMDHNELEALDLTPFTKLMSISLTDNPFNVSPLIVGADKPNLAILTLDIIDNMSADFNISDYPLLQSFSAWNNKGLHSLDPTGCPELLRLSIDGTDVSTLDLSNNSKLRILNITDTRVVDFDLSILPELREFYAQHQSGTLNTDIKLTSIDVSQNPRLAYLYLAGNNLTQIDLSQNEDLMMLNVSHNLLTGLDLSHNPNLVNVNYSYNYMDYTTMPVNPGTWNEVYTQQNPIKIDWSYPVGATIDFASKVILPDSETYATLLLPDPENPSKVTELGDEYFSFADGICTLKKEVADSVRIEFYNPTFPDAPLATSEFRIKSLADFGKPTPMAVFSGSYNTGDRLELKVGVEGATPENPQTIYVDFGDGTEKEIQVTASSMPLAANVTGTVTGYQLKVLAPDGVFITDFALNHPLYSFTCDEMAALRNLDLAGCGLYSINLKNSPRLETLDLSDNNLYSIDLSGPYSGKDKILLGDINLAGNKLSEFQVPDNSTLKNLNLSRNQIAEISFRDADNLLSLDISENLLTSLDVVYCELMTSLHAQGNQIEEITLPQTNVLTDVDLSDNRLTLASLPAPTLFPGASYIYEPQAVIEIPSKGPGVNLSSQCVDIDGNSTEFAWIKSDGTACVEGTDYTVSNGRTSFLTTEIGKVYCRITNGGFPGLALLTTEIEAAERPTNVVAEFTTPTGGQTVELSLAAVSGAPAIYFDWSGEGDLDQYQLKDTYTRFSATTTAGANVKVYTYGGDDDRISVFSISGATMENMDASRLTDLVCLAVANAGLSEISLPQTSSLRELNLGGNYFYDIDLSGYPQLLTLDLSNNLLTSFDLSPFQNLIVAGLAYNALDDVTLDNPNLWSLSLAGNNLEQLDLSKVPMMQQLALSQNKLETIDVDQLTQLRAITLDNNCFNFATLPLKGALWTLYAYANQQPVEAVLSDEGTVDLAFNLKAKDETETVYTWYIGVPSFDEEGNLTGDALDTSAVTVDGGVSTFLTSEKNVMCVMTNQTFPDLYMYTMPMDVILAGVDGIEADANLKISAADGCISLSASRDIEAALFTLDGKLAGKTRTLNGEARFSGLGQGVYILATSAGTYKVILK